ncbi:helix-turn-helix domain-containing protein [Parendozoicomonas sp. Alg238-R29]|uniref:helix-turn-helix domain-containing protein n=1 Tax=Parendozoicomonas sp. Alg238-R29 TaxID=2993446 RepID=UPI00248E4273|nr:helix-turn-helix domain-containing protein [Parendozoicomonas sp. Alg238-R29]
MDDAFMHWSATPTESTTDFVLLPAGLLAAGKDEYQHERRGETQFPHTTDFLIRRISTTDIEQLKNSEVGRHRRYLQLNPGTLENRLCEIKLDGVILVREQLNVGVQIQAGPPDNFFPLAVALSPPARVRFCGQEVVENTMFQGTGGEWDMAFNHPFGYMSSVLDTSVLENWTTQLTNHEPHNQWFVSRMRCVPLPLLKLYKARLADIFFTVERSPEILHNPNVRHVLSQQIIYLSVKLLFSTLETCSPLEKSSRRLKGVQRVVEYLKVHAGELPTLPELCAVAQLSERSLEYGFREQLGVTPIRYLTLVRLNGARRDLYLSDPVTTRVADVAMSWGFIELGRFSGVYARMFQERPLQTLRRIN